ncbi:MAG: hypothetical protein U5L01_15580 [Rheinheimera sp.]|nr:hypothetical protein [Rheinheimera sp.]
MSIEESRYRPFEEASHSISHGIGALLSVVGTVLIWQQKPTAWRIGNNLQQLCYSVLV